MIETHPLEPFVPKNARYLLIGSFMAKAYGSDSYDWYYGSKRNQFWPILEETYNLKLNTIESKQELLTRLNLAITDIIYQCERQKGSSLDANLINIVYNTPAIEKILRDNKIEKIFFSSRFVETKFRKLFTNISIELITLPSPSPRYAAMTKSQKITRYKELLPTFVLER